MFDIRHKISDRIKACRLAKGWTYRETASQLSAISKHKVSTSCYGNWDQGINMPPTEQLIAMAQLFGKPAAWLAALTDDDGSSPVAANYAMPMIQPISTANGMLNLNDDTLAFRRTFLAESNMDPDSILLVEAQDDSMTGMIAQGDRVLIDLSDNQVRRDDVFAMIVSGRLWLRWIRQNIGGDYCISAELSDRYPDEVVSAETLESMHILGRVRLIAHIR